jgi:hypothetical protein
MAQSFNPEKIEKIDEIGLEKSAGLDKLTEQLQNDIEAQSRVKFDQALAKADPSHITAAAPPVQNQVAIIPEVEKKPSILDIAGKQLSPEQLVTPPTQAQVIDRAELARGKFASAIDQLKQNVTAPIGAPDRASMTASLQHADRYLSQALSSVTGVEAKSAIDVSNRPPLMRFLSFLTEGQKRLDNLISGISEVESSGKKLSPENLLGVQIRLGFVQNEIEFFTSVLNKSLEAVKTTMNVQI